MSPYKILVFSLIISCFSLAQTENRSPDCQNLMMEGMDFLVDGSFTDESALERNLQPLTSCGLDDYDIRFFGRMNYMSGILNKLTQSKPIEQLTYGDLMYKIEPIIVSEKYIEIKKASLKSEDLGNRVGNEQTWAEDKLVFEDLGASQRIIDAVGDYLKEHPNNQKTYREILEMMDRKE